MTLMRKLLGKSEETNPTAAETHTPAVSTTPVAAVHRGNFVPHVVVGHASHAGRVRSHNEDTALTFEANYAGEEALEPFGLFVLADGMGGHQAGEVASSLAVRTFASQIMRNVYIPYLLKGASGPDQMPLAEALQNAVESANEAVHGQVPGSGTTLTCALVINQRAYLAHVGDSRAYLYYNQQLKQVTRDHSYVDKLVELGQLTVEAAAVHPQRNVLYRAVGQGDQLEIDIHMIDLPPSGRLLLCCDGLWGMLPDSTIQSILASARTPQQACDELIAAANEAGGKDNITAVVIEQAAR